MSSNSAHVIPGLLFISLSYVREDGIVIIVVISLAFAFNGAASLTNMQNPQDLAPNHAAIIYAIANCIATSSGFLTPVVATYFVTDSVIEFEKFLFIFD